MIGFRPGFDRCETSFSARCRRLAAANGCTPAVLLRGCMSKHPGVQTPMEAVDALRYDTDRKFYTSPTRPIDQTMSPQTRRLSQSSWNLSGGPSPEPCLVVGLRVNRQVHPQESK